MFALQIGETLTRFGIHDSCQHLLLARFDATPEQASVRVLQACDAAKQAGTQITTPHSQGAYTMPKRFKIGFILLGPRSAV